VFETEAMVEYSRIHGAQPGEPPIHGAAVIEPEHQGSDVEAQADEPPQQIPNIPNTAGNRRGRGAERDRGYLLQPVAKLASEFYGEESAKELFEGSWRTHLIRGKVVEFVKGSGSESDRWNATWSDDGSTLLMKASEVEAAMAIEARKPRQASPIAPPLNTSRTSGAHPQRARRAAAHARLAALESSNTLHDYYTAQQI
jgi:hypothetical protein